MCELPDQPLLYIHALRMELSSNQVKEAVHTVAIDKWRHKVPLKTQQEMYRVCSMLKELGYLP